MSINKKRSKKFIGIGASIIGVVFIGMSILARKKKPSSFYEDDKEEKNPFEGKKVVLIEDENDKENADGIKGHLEVVGDSEYKPGFYEKRIKRAIDVVLSFGGLVILSPVFAVIALAIKIEDPGPVLFTQKRVGQNKRYFKLHKFRSMKMCTPHDVPTHQLENPEQYITRVGKFLRAHSLDELPQIWDIFIGNMSVIGPRPGLWNQDLLTAERDRYGANDVKPGLTGWAQINGRDELEIPDKARLDGEYVSRMGPWMDIKCFLGSVHVFRKDDSMVEGGVGELKKQPIGRHYTEGKSDKELIGHIGFGEPVEVNDDAYKRVLVTGAGSYIGEAFRSYAKEHYPDSFSVDALNMLNSDWKEYDFSYYDIVYHVAGIAHADVGNVSNEIKEKYYAVNTDLALEVARKAKEEGVKEFVFMSSMIVYGESAPYGEKKVVNRHTVPAPANFYGDSKLQADVGVRELADKNFKVIVLRPPMIYGKGSKGNYPTLVKIAKKAPIFPNVDNERSMLYIENLCEFLCQIMLVKEFRQNAVVLIPQNGEWTKTSEMVKEIAKVSGRKIETINFLNPAVYIASKIPGKVNGLVNKAFGNMVYDQSLSKYEGLDYQKVEVEESIRRTEDDVMQNIKYNTKDSNIHPKKVLFLVNHDVVIYNFRRELVERLLSEGYEVVISSPYGQRIDLLKEMGCRYVEVKMDRHGMNPINEIGLLVYYRKLILDISPDIIFSYTIKPNLYGAMVAGKVPIVVNITGLGTAVEKGGIVKQAIIFAYRQAFKNVKTVFVQNEENRKFFQQNNIATDKLKLIPGSGVNLSQWKPLEYPENDDCIRFLFVGRLMEDKGVAELVQATRILRGEGENLKVDLVGFCEEDYKTELEKLNAQEYLSMHGEQMDIVPYLRAAHAVVLPSYHEGMANVLLEAAASARPVLASSIPGCKETFEEDITGVGFECRNINSLVNAMRKFINLPHETKRQMGICGRKKMEKEFDRSVIIEKYMNEL
uniref:sugar transferase n=1 Tax=Lachnoclostridium phocaeense TaxID=1871021 RepID=UPI0026DC1614|nr:sugar transferase [Lachnoclostridium phocaeense]